MNDTNMNKENDLILSEVWNIRDIIKELEAIKDEFIGFIQAIKSLDEITAGIWITDAKEWYYHIVSAWEMLYSTVKDKKDHLEDSKGFFYAAKSQLAKSISELNIFKNNELPDLIERAEVAFQKCSDTFLKAYKKLEPTKKTGKKLPRILQLSETMFQLPCFTCGKIAVEFKIGYGRFDKEESLVFTGITHSTSLKKTLAKILFEVLKADDIEGIHEFMKTYHPYEGLDAYCPECDKIYCWEHYHPVEEWDEGFYDCTYGTCPKGHKRMIDD